MQFDMNRTWSQAIALVKGNFQLLAIIAGVFLLLPSVLMYLLFPDLLVLMSADADPEALVARMEAMVPQLMGYGTLGMLVQMVGYMAMIALMGTDRPTVGEAILRGIKALPTLLGAAIVFACGYIVAALVVGLLLGLVVGALSTVSEAAGTATAGILTFGLFAAILYVMVRFCLTLPVIVLDGIGNPLKALARSWRLTGPRAWAIVGFFAMLFIAYMVLVMVLFIVIGGLGLVSGAQLGGGSVLVLGLLTGIVGAFVSMLLSGILVSIHQQLAVGAAPTDAEFNA